MRPLDLPPREAADAVLGAFFAHLEMIRSGRPTFVADVSVQRCYDTSMPWQWTEIRNTRMTVAYPTLATLDMLVDCIVDLYSSTDFTVRVTAAVMDQSGDVKIAYRTIGPTWSRLPLTPAGNAA